MKKNHLIILLMIALVSCKEESNPINVDEINGEKVIFNFNVNGIVNFDDQPIDGRINTNGDPTYYLLDIDDITNTTVGYASGVFDHLPTNIDVELYIGRDYQVNVKALRKGETFGIAITQDSILRASSQGDIITNRIVYGNSLSTSFTTNNDTYYYPTADSSSIAKTLTTSGGFGGGPKPTPLDTYLGQATINQVLPIDSTIYFYLARNAFAFESTINNLNSGALLIKVSGISKQFDRSSEMTWGNTYSYGYLSTDSSLYSTNMLVSVIKYDTVATVVESEVLFNQSIPFKRLHRKFINITLPQDTAVSDTTAMSNFIITLEDEQIVNGDTLIID